MVISHGVCGYTLPIKTNLLIIFIFTSLLAIADIHDIVSNLLGCLKPMQLQTKESTNQI